ncbi:MAG: hypothetical protein CMF61_08245 [Magnetococcales bacterium]|nr:hypothetical protein [Magnetococcales bacterium]PPR17725.1 MAG: hypothetical protein CFH43_00653 [Pseudomonadota bacterium]|tara:strand:- start:215 stop:520 length:306 start_codon:yes stop_codon:yes gene_type:complete
MKKLTLICFAALLLTACGDPNPMVTSSGAGFLGGLWDGLTCIFAFIFSIFGGDYNIYEVVNTGNWYNFGFLLGLLGSAATFWLFIWVILQIIGAIILAFSK